MSPPELRPATLADVPTLHALIQAFAEQNLLLSRTAGELYETIRDFLVLTEGEELIGCVALHIVNARLSEIKSLAVARRAQGRGLGRQLVGGAIEAAAVLGLERVFCLTYQQRFFEHQGFTLVDRARLPEKVWGECVRCNKFLNCDELALWRPVAVQTPG